MVTKVTHSMLNASLQAFRNKVINGDFRIWQRGTAFVSPASQAYVADRWQVVAAGSSFTSVTRQALSIGQVDLPGEPQYFLRAVVSSVSDPASLALIRQKIEGVRTLAGEPAVFGLYAKADAGQRITVELSQEFGTGGTPSASVTGIGVTKSQGLSTDFELVASVVVDVPSLAGKTLGTNGDDSLNLNIWLDAGSDYDARTDSLGYQSGTFDIALVQIMPGAEMPPFESRPLAIEETLCRRYYRQAGRGLTGVWDATSRAIVGMRLDPPMRAAPTPTLLSTAATLAHNGSTLTAAGGTLDDANLDTRGGSVRLLGFTGATIGQATYIRSPGDVIALDAEL